MKGKKGIHYGSFEDPILSTPGWLYICTFRKTRLEPDMGLFKEDTGLERVLFRFRVGFFLECMSFQSHQCLITRGFGWVMAFLGSAMLGTLMSQLVSAVVCGTSMVVPVCEGEFYRHGRCSKPVFTGQAQVSAKPLISLSLHSKTNNSGSKWKKYNCQSPKCVKITRFGLFEAPGT